ncbi:glycogen debranching protein [Eisenbergiella massiliensis]|uniref:glycogen debranching protein n=1 Tax=Eisenbergiella massiliensis TaxID=1720294 RepID=UPI0023EFAFD5|nr:alpha-amylase family glycosyl hydrolase [Eisenbergiella massiliensis]
MKNMSQSTDPQFPPHENTPLITTAQPGSAYLLESITGEEISSNLKPLDKINGYDVRPGFYEVNGASALPGGVNFTLASHGATSCALLLFHRKSSEPFASIPFPEHYRIGNVFSMIVFGLRIDEFEYAYRLDGPYQPEKGLIYDKTKYILDPYAKAVTGQSEWGIHLPCTQNCQYKSRVVRNNFDWGNSKQPLIPMKDNIIYELHVRGFTRHSSSGVHNPGTFAGLMEKIPYMKELGINAVELMPIFEFDEMNGCREVNGRKLLDYWGYNPVCFFAPNTSYTAQIEYNQEGLELKKLIKALNENGIEVILDVVFNHTAEGNELGPYFSFKGLDNNIYYMLTPDGHYYNFSGCGNTLNCNHPIVRQMILDCLRYWVINYRVDGFRFDLASILGRSEDAAPMSRPPLLESLAYDPILGNVDLIAEAWDAGGLYQVGSFPSWNRWAEWNGKYRDDIRSFLKGDDGYAAAAAQRIMGSPDLYPPDKRSYNASVNFLTCHDGFTLYDLYSYSTKHNEANGWNNTDGADDNRSWNCGYEGPTNNGEIMDLRFRMIKNACAVLMCSRGTPMFLAGDEFGNTQFGNNNSYCQDNEISWLDWSLLEKNKEIFEFFRYMIAFRQQHSVIRGNTAPCSCGFPPMSLHCIKAWDSSYVRDTRFLGVMFSGIDSTGRDDIVYLGINTFWKPLQIELPALPSSKYWIPAVDTGRGDMSVITEEEILDKSVYVMNPRSVLVCVVRDSG